MRMPMTRIPHFARLMTVLAVLVPLSSCTQTQLDSGTASSYLILTSLTAASGATPSDFSGVLPSDVITNVRTTIGDEQVLVPTIFEDFGQASFDLAIRRAWTCHTPSTAP
jgi:hypothetical protein